MIIKILPLPIPVGTPIAAPVHIGVPAVPPFAASHYGQYESFPLLMTHSLPTKRVDKKETKQVGNRRSAGADYSDWYPDNLIGGYSDNHTRITHHYTHTHGLPSGKILSLL